MRNVNLWETRKRKKTLVLYWVLVFLLCLPLIGLAGTRVYKAYVFKIRCKGHLKRAADANTIPLAIQEMEVVVSYLAEHDMTEGYTSIIIQTPDEDVGFWYQNLKASLEELRSISPDAQSLEKSNVLMKLRETILDEGQSNNVTTPNGIVVFPYNREYAAGMFFSVLIVILAGVIILTKSDIELTLIEIMIVVSIIGIFIALAAEF